jgi:hypothetical protein
VAVQEFGPEWRVTAMIVVVGGGFSLLWLGLARELKNEPVPWLVLAVWSAAFVALLLWQAWFRVWVNETGMWWRGLLSEGELRWSEIEQVFYSTHKISAPVIHIHIPLGTYQRLRVVDARGKKVRFHYRVREADVLLEWIRQKTKERLLAKAEGMFASGATVEFGAVRVHRTEGVTARLWYATREMQWEEIGSCEIGQEVVFRLKVWRLGGGCKLSGDRVANVHVLRAMLVRIFQARSEGVSQNGGQATP